MNVVLDISPLHTGHKTRGIGIYTRELICALKKIDRANRYLLTTRPQDVKRVSLIHYPYFDLFFRSLPLWNKLPTVVTIHDVIPLVFRREFRPGLRGKLAYYLQRFSLHSIKTVITDSHHSRTDIIKYLGVPAPKIQVIPLAASIAFSRPPSVRQIHRVSRKYHLPPNFLLYVGDINSHKNLPRLLEAFNLLTTTFPQLSLVLVSRALNQPIPEARNLKEIIENSHLTAKIKLLTAVPMTPLTDLNCLYRLARAYVHPSLYEGFGLPVLEAMSAGTVVVSSTAASLPEIYADVAITIDPKSTASIVAGVTQALQLTKAERQSLIDRGKLQAAKFSWLDTARQTRQIYRKIINE